MSKKNEKTSKIYAGIYLLTIVITVFVLELYSSLEIDFFAVFECIRSLTVYLKSSHIYFALGSFCFVLCMA